jgi:hypothetical protein
MADKWYTAASGLWSTAANWNSGTLPTAADDVYADGKAVVIDQNVDVLSIRTTQRSGGTVGGSFTVNTGGYTITCTSATGMISSTSAVAINITATSGTTTINSNLTGGTSVVAIVTLTGASNLNINGNILAGNGNGAKGLTISAVGATVTIVGNCQGGTSGSDNSGILITANSVLTITGNVTGGSGATSPAINNTTVAATINITGNVTSQVSAGILSTIASVVTVKGIVTSSNTIAAISLSSASSSLTFSGQAINNNNVMAIFCPVVRLYTDDTVQWTFQNNTGGTKILYSAGTPVLGNPATTDVRNGTIYGASNELTGTLIVPSPSNVVAGVQTDNTVGTYSTTPALIATEIFTKLLSNSDFNTSGSFGKLIKDNVDAKSSEIKAKTDLIPTNPASVQSVGAIVASYNV